MIHVERGIRLPRSDRGRELLFSDRLDTDDRFDRPRRAEGVTDLPLRRRHAHLREPRPEHLRERRGLVAGVHGELALARGDAEEAFRRIGLALELEREIDRPDGIAWYAAFAAKVGIVRGDREFARGLMAKAKDSLPGLGSSLTGLTTRLYLADDHWLLGERDAARALWREVETDAQRRGLAMLALEARIGLACDDAKSLAARVADARAMGFGRGVAWAAANCPVH